MPEAPPIEPNLCLVRAESVEEVARAVEETLIDDGYFLLVQDDAHTPERTILLAEVAAGWVAVWDPVANAGPALDGWPDGDPATSLARGLSAVADSDVLYLYAAAPLWGYVLYRIGLTVDRFASDPRRVAPEFEVDAAQASIFLRGDVLELRRILADPAAPEENVVAVLSSGEEAILGFLALLGIPTSLSLSEKTLTPLERSHCLALPFAERL